MTKKRIQVGADASEAQAERGALERAVAGALRSTIHDHGSITPEAIGSAVKRVVGNLRNARPTATSEAAATLGRKGGAAGRGAAKRRQVDYAALGAAGGASRWASISPEDRSAEMKRRRRKGLRKKGAQ